MFSLALLALTAQSNATTIIFQDDIQGGVAVDASGVDASDLLSGGLASGDPFVVMTPSTADITEAYLLLHSKPDGFLATESAVRINGFDLSFGSVISTTSTTEVYSLPPSVYGISAGSTVTYQEEASAETGFHFGPGIHGATLVVIYEDTTLNGNRHVVLATDNVSAGAVVLTGLPELNAMDSVVLSYGITNECANDQFNAVVVDSAFVSAEAGGSDDGPIYDGSCGGQDWNTLLTQGSFGVDDTDTMTGVGGDSLEGPPVGGTPTNSRLDDELYRVGYDRSGDLTLAYSDSSEDSQLAVVVAAFELDTDGDGVADSADNCPDDFNPDQIDTDVDGTGDACAGCLDVDGDGFGADGITDDCPEDGVDCDDYDASIYPGAPEIWYDGIDQDCNGLSDYDSDEDGSDATSAGGEDCDDTDDDVGPHMEEIWYNGVDNACDGGCDFDQDGDGCPAADSYEDALLDPACDVSCFESGVDAPDEDTGDFGDTGALVDTGDTGDTGVLDLGDTGAFDDTGGPDDGDGVISGGDCDDTDPTALPSATEIWYDGVDQDCDGNDDDKDGDGEAGVEAGGTDCDDLNPDINTTATEIWYNDVDENCDGNLGDRDEDGFDDVSFGGTDCDDADPLINPGAPEIWYDGVDQDCSGTSDYDQDGDGFDSAEQAEDGTDCDDENHRIYPTASEIWYDGVDQDCSGTSDYDQDGDGFDRRPEGEDCNDLESTINPDADEINGDDIDQDCDGDLDFYADSDEDGYADDIDCDPANPEIFPDMPGFDGCEEIVDPGLIGKGLGEYKGGGCSQAPDSDGAPLWLLGLTLLGLRRRPVNDADARTRA